MKKQIILTTISFLIGFGFSNLAQAKWDLNDVSYLMPIPQNLEKDRLLRMKSAASGGDLLPPAILKDIPALTMHIPQDELVDSLRVVAIRIDPCFPLPTDSDCQRQVRLVWQPFELDRQDKVQSVDAALHSFHILSEQEFKSLTSELKLWKTKNNIATDGEPLQVHPAWSTLGDQSPSLVSFYRIILKYVGPSNLFRVTAMVLRGAGNMWGFVTLEPQDGKFKMQPIARLPGKVSQTFINMAVPADHFEGQGIMPRPQGPDTINSLFMDTLQSPLSDEIVTKEFESLYRIENPKNFHAENMDCVSCHVAQTAKHYYLNKRGHLKLDQLWNSAQYFNPNYNLENISSTLNDTQMIRAFGYFGDNVSISQRVINESAEVADWLNKSNH